MILKINEYNSSHMLTNNINFSFSTSFDRNTKKHSINRVLDFLIMWYTCKKSIFSNCLFIEYSSKSWVISKDDTSILFFQTLSDILNALGWKE